MDESTLLYQEGASDGAAEGRQVVLQLPEGCDAAEGVIMQIEGDKIHIITPGGQLGNNALGLAMESLMEEGPSEQPAVSPDSRLVSTAGEDCGELREEEGEAEMEDGAGGEDRAEMSADDQPEIEEVAEVSCFVCSGLCRRPAPLLLTRAAGSGVSLAERLGSLLPLRLHCTAQDGVCGDCGQLIEQADMYHTQLKALELQVRQLFHLEEKMEAEERRQEQERESARVRQEALARRREQERRRQQERAQEEERRRGRIQDRVKAGEAAGKAERPPLAHGEHPDSGDEPPPVAAETPADPAPPPAADVTEEWGPRKVYSGRRRRPRRPWSPSDCGKVKDQDQGTGTGDRADRSPPASGPDGVPTTTIEFVTFDRPSGATGRHTRPTGRGGVRRRRRAGRPPGSSAFYCRRCDTSFESSSSLVLHITSSHRRPWCRRCRVEFDSQSLLNRHRRLCRDRPALDSQPPGDEQAEGAERPQHRLSPKVIEFRDVSTLREQVKDVRTPRFSLKFRPASAADLEKIQHLTVSQQNRAVTPAETTDRPVTPPPASTNGGKAGPKRSHSCQRCGLSVASLPALVEHLHTAHAGRKWCRRCRSEFPSGQPVSEHRQHCRRAALEGECPQCGKRVRNLRAHLKTHQQPKKRRSRQSVLGPDGKVVSASLAGGECSICKKYISHRLKRHMNSHVQHACPICRKVFSREDVIAGHIKRVHMKERPFMCNLCGKGFVSLYSMQRHEMIHTNSYRFYCQECGDGFRQKQQLTAHMKHKHGVVEIEFEDVRESAILNTIATELRFYCQECGCGFHSRSQLTAHMRHKHGVANVVFEDVQLHVASTIEHLGAVSVPGEGEPEPADPGRQLTPQTTDPAGPETDRDGAWWEPDHGAEY